MHEFSFDPADACPLVSAVIAGPKGGLKVLLILDTGGAGTQIREATAHKLGFCDEIRKGTARSKSRTM